MSEGLEEGGEGRRATLDLKEGELRELARVFNELAAGYVSEPEALPVFPATSAGRVAALFAKELPREPVGLEAIARDCGEVLRNSRQNGHPRMFGYVASPASAAGVYASLLASALNSNVTSWRSAPAATAVERTVVRWLAEMVGYVGRGVKDPPRGLL